MVTPPIERFLAKIAVDPQTYCWLWTKSTFGGGYAQFMLRKGRNTGGHIFAYEHWVGPVPAGMQLDHDCRVKQCVNPDHVTPRTPAENVLRGLRGTTRLVCKNGHWMLGENLVLHQRTRNTNPERMCRLCKQAAERRNYHRRKRSRLDQLSDPEVLR
jgi:hypothetical protein